jgi:hypothetical protein
VSEWAHGRARAWAKTKVKKRRQPPKRPPGFAWWVYPVQAVFWVSNYVLDGRTQSLGEAFLDGFFALCWCYGWWRWWEWYQWCRQEGLDHRSSRAYLPIDLTQLWPFVYVLMDFLDDGKLNSF